MKRFTRKIVSLCLIFSFTIALLSSCAKKTEQEQFNEIIDNIFEEEVTQDSLSLHYLLAHPENYGIKTSKTTLGTYSTKQMKKDLIDTENVLAKLEKLDTSQLDNESKITYSILTISLKNSLCRGNYLYLSDQLGPTTGLQAQLPILLAEYNLSSRDDIDKYLELLLCVDDYFKQICDYEKEKSQHGYFMVDEVADSIIAQCCDFINDPENNFLITYFNEKLNNFINLTEKEKILYKEKNKDAILNSVIPAYENLIVTLDSLKGTATNEKGLCGFEGGKEYYELIAQSTTGSSKSVKEMEQSLKKALNSSFAMLTSLSIQDPTLYDQYQTLTFPYEDPTEIMEYLTISMADDFPAINSVKYNVKYVHESLQQHLSPAMYIVPPIDDCTENNIYINNLPSYDMTKIFPTIAHEGYPGHLYQNVYFSQLNKHPIRSVLNVKGYDEGWATYVECYSYNLANIKDNLARFLQSNMIAVHCLYSLTDIGIHYNGWTKEKTIQFWRNYVSSDQEAESIYYAILAEPGVYLPYSIGYLEIIELRNLAKRIQGDKFSLKEFHEFLLNFGPAPFELIRESLVSELK